MIGVTALATGVHAAPTYTLCSATSTGAMGRGAYGALFLLLIGLWTK